MLNLKLCHYCQLLILLCCSLFACKRSGEKYYDADVAAPKVVKAEDYIQPAIKSQPPIVIQASKGKLTLAGTPEVIQLKSNTFPATISRTTPAGPPKLVLSSGTKAEHPQTTRAIDSPYAAGAPDMITLDATYVTENNPESIISIKAMHGLNSNEISSLLADRNGNLWIGAWWGGVSRYDGRYLANYGIPQGLTSDIVHCLFEDREGNIWIGTSNGANKFDGKSITQFSVREGLIDNFVWSILQDKNGDMWFATDNGLSRLHNHSFIHYKTAQGLPSNRVRSLLEDDKGNLWVGTFGGLTRFNGQFFETYTTALHFNENTEVASLLDDGNGNIWFATNLGLFKYDGHYFSHYTTEGGLSSNTVSKLMKENSGDIWVGTRGAGANRYNGRTFVHLRTEHGLANENISSMLQDKRGNIWLGTTAGVCKYDGKLFNHIKPVNLEEIECLMTDKDGNVWMASGSGYSVNKYDGKSIARYSNEHGLSNTAINQILQDIKGNIWFASRNGVDQYDGKYFTHYNTVNGLVDSVVFCALEDKKGNLWFGTEKGLSKFDGKSFTNYLPPQGLCGETIFTMAEDHLGNIWLGTNEKGACKFDGTSFTNYTFADSLNYATVLGILEDSHNNIWFCTNMGVNKFDGKQFTWYTTGQGLTSNITKNVLEDERGNIWVGTLNGLNRYIPRTTTNDKSDHTARSYFKKYMVAEGFSGAGTYEHCLIRDNSGGIWIGANDRLTKYHHEGEIPDTLAPQIHLTGLSLFDQKMNWSDIAKKKKSGLTDVNNIQLKGLNFSNLSPWYNIPGDLLLDHNNNHVTFHFTGITTNRPKEVKYRYMLQGFDKNWNVITQQPSAVYNNLPPGEFTFRVKAANSEGYWSDELKYSFVVLTPWWKQWWAYLVYAIAAAGLIWIFIWYRSRWLKAENVLLEEKVERRTNELQQSLEERYRLSKQIESQQALLNERLRISRELHDDIGSTLGSISMYSEVAKKRAEKNENPIKALSKIGTSSRELIDKMSDIVWSLNTDNESIDQLGHRMVDFAAMMLAPRNIIYHFIIDEQLRSMLLTSVKAKNILLIYKEALYNMVKYADCSKATITLGEENNELLMVISDDGKGFNPRTDKDPMEIKNSGGNGIKNMHSRAEDIQGKLNIATIINEGTTITLRIPL